MLHISSVGVIGLVSRMSATTTPDQLTPLSHRAVGVPKRDRSFLLFLEQSLYAITGLEKKGNVYGWVAVRGVGRNSDTMFRVRQILVSLS